MLVRRRICLPFSPPARAASSAHQDDEVRGARAGTETTSRAPAKTKLQHSSKLRFANRRLGVAMKLENGFFSEGRNLVIEVFVWLSLQVSPRRTYQIGRAS